jgi:uroporphyrinogen-III synthase
LPRSAEPVVAVLRSRPGADRTAEAVRALGFSPFVAPLLTVRAVAAEVAVAPGEVVAVTSAHGATALASLTDPSGLTLYAVGEGTAQAALRAGFGRVIAGPSDAAALADVIVSDRPSSVLVARGREVAADLAGMLTAKGVPARSVVVYAAYAAEALPADLAAALSSGGLDAALIHSPRIGTILADLAPPGALAGVRLLAISAAAAAPLAGLGPVTLSAHPSEAGLLEALQHAMGDKG